MVLILAVVSKSNVGAGLRARPRSRPPGRVVPTLVLFFVAPIWAQQDSAAPRDTFYETATVEARAVEDATSSVTVLDEEDLRSLGTSDIAESLSFVPGLSLVTPSRGSGGAAHIRGGDPNFSLVLLDGVPINDSTDSLGGAFNLSSFSTFGLKRVEVVRGPVSSFYGTAGLGGAINLVTGGKEDGGRFVLDLEGGSHDRRRLGLTLGGGREAAETSGLWGSLSAHSEEEEGRVAPDRVAPDRFEQTALLASGSWQPSESRRLDLRLRVADWEADDWPEGSGGPSFGTGVLRRSDHRESVVAFAAEIVTAGFHHRLSLSCFGHQADFDSPALPPQIPPSVASTDFDRTRLFYTATRGRNDSLWSVGAELGRQVGRNHSFLFLPPFLGGAIPGDYDLERGTVGVLFEGIHAVSPRSGSLTVEGGLRFDSPDGARDEWSPRVGIGYRPGDGAVRVHGSFGRAFKLPSFFALGSPRALGGNPALEPEVSVGGDLGLDLELLDGDLAIGVTAFRSDYRDLIDFDFATFQLVNRSRVRAAGAELSVVGRPGRRIQIHANATFQSVEDETTGDDLLRRPDNYGSVVVSWQPSAGAGDPFRLLLDLRFQGRAFDEQVPTGRRELDSYSLVGLAAEWVVHPRLAIRARVDNLFDEGYQTQIGTPGPGTSGRVGLRIPLL